MNDVPLVQNNEKDSINTSIIAIKKNLERINSLLGLVDSGEPDLSGLATKQELENAVTEINDTIDEVETSLQPVNTVTSGNMHSVTSNAVYGKYDELKWKNSVFSKDTRNENQTPLYYMQNYKRGVAVEFKSRQSISAPVNVGIYCILLTLVLWSDSSGGYPMQIAMGTGHIAMRTGASNTSWGSWSNLH